MEAITVTSVITSSIGGGGGTLFALVTRHCLCVQGFVAVLIIYVVPSAATIMLLPATAGVSIYVAVDIGIVVITDSGRVCVIAVRPTEIGSGDIS